MKGNFVILLLLVILLIGLVYSVNLWILGQANFVTCLFFYFSMFFLPLLFSSLLFRKNKKELILLFSSLLFVFIFIESILRFNLKVFETYSERKGNKIYLSQHGSLILNRFYPRRIKFSDNQMIYPKLRKSYIEKSSEFEFEHKYNNHGFRSYSNLEPKEDSIFRIIALGDSYTEGIGAHQDSTWTEFFLRKYNADESVKQKLEIINAGISGSDPFFQEELLTRDWETLNPDGIVFCTNYSDLEDVSKRGGQERFQDNDLLLKPGPKWEIVYANSFLFRLIAHNLLGLNWLLEFDKDYATKKEIAISKLAAHFNQIAKECRTNNIPILLVLHPVNYESCSEEILISEIKKEINFKDSPCFSILELNKLFRDDNMVFEQDKCLNKYFWDFDGHNNAKGYALFGEEVFNKIKEENWIE